MLKTMFDSQLLGFLIGDGWCYKDAHRNYMVVLHRAFEIQI